VLPHNNVTCLTKKKNNNNNNKNYKKKTHVKKKGKKKRGAANHPILAIGRDTFGHLFCHWEGGTIGPQEVAETIQWPLGVA
jgi:hypothetical protein